MLFFLCRWQQIRSNLTVFLLLLSLLILPLHSLQFHHAPTRKRRLMLTLRRLNSLLFKQPTSAATSPTASRSFNTSLPPSDMASPFSRAVVRSMRALYPECLADKSFDNTGLLLEVPFLKTRRNKNSVLLTVDLTKAVAEDAIENKHSVVVAYHPIIFRGLKSITLDDTQQQSLLRLAAHGVSVYSPHTAVDIVPGGMGDWLCDIVTGKLDAPEPEAFSVDPVDTESTASEVSVTTSEGLTDDEPESKSSTAPATPPQQEAASTEEGNGVPATPKQAKQKQRPLAHRTYSRPSYPSAPANFHPGSLQHSRTVITSSPASDIEAANKLTEATPYEASNTGSGRLITFNTSQPLTLLITRIAHAIGLPKGFPVAIPQGSNVEDMYIKTVGVCPGSGASVLRNCRPAPDLVFTGEMSHHEALAVTERGGCVVSLFHSNSERGYLWGVMTKNLTEKLKTVWAEEREKLKSEGNFGDGIEEILEDDSIEVVVSERDRDPFGIVVLQESTVEGIELTPERKKDVRDTWSRTHEKAVS